MRLIISSRLIRSMVHWCGQRSACVTSKQTACHHRCHSVHAIWQCQAMHGVKRRDDEEAEHPFNSRWGNCSRYIEIHTRGNNWNATASASASEVGCSSVEQVPTYLTMYEVCTKQSGEEFILHSHCYLGRQVDRGTGRQTCHWVVENGKSFRGSYTHRFIKSGKMLRYEEFPDEALKTGQNMFQTIGLYPLFKTNASTVCSHSATSQGLQDRFTGPSGTLGHMAEWWNEVG